jgi:hypothetical protein
MKLIHLLVWNMVLLRKLLIIYISDSIYVERYALLIAIFFLKKKIEETKL